MTAKKQNPPPFNYPHPSGLRPVSPLPPPPLPQVPSGGGMVDGLLRTLTRLEWIESTLRWFARNDLCDALHLSDVNGRLQLTVLVGEAFGGADAETLTPENLPVFVAATEDLREATGNETTAWHWAGKLFAQRVRGTPQRWNRMPEDERIVKLFKAAARRDGAE